MSAASLLVLVSRNWELESTIGEVICRHLLGGTIVKPWSPAIGVEFFYITEALSSVSEIAGAHECRDFTARN